MSEPIAYLVAERRDGQWLLDDDWTHRCDTLDEARQVAESWRLDGIDPDSIGVLAVTVVPNPAEVPADPPIDPECDATRTIPAGVHVSPMHANDSPEQRHQCSLTDDHGFWHRCRCGVTFFEERAS